MKTGTYFYLSRTYTDLKTDSQLRTYKYVTIINVSTRSCTICRLKKSVLQMHLQGRHQGVINQYQSIDKWQEALRFVIKI